ncbi:hypothetical protein GQ55_3G347600 [Panicum hallii var. hallii]|uniref:Uncharacterized protein n=1 Tax=Panicum hallii var. hallii TaxID=1504633 RepID=A0A2T7EFR3_9POAL|nr:hypothetical protein GQ55_3G347600 [Panicum hallii var. hallii]
MVGAKSMPIKFQRNKGANRFQEMRRWRLVSPKKFSNTLKFLSDSSPSSSTSSEMSTPRIPDSRELSRSHGAGKLNHKTMISRLSTPIPSGKRLTSREYIANFKPCVAVWSKNPVERETKKKKVYKTLKQV